jgi:non-ribosomal peptide synthetase component E (peptide arylation enzyme)
MSVEVWPELPKTAVGKIDKREVRERFWAHADRAIN